VLRIAGMFIDGIAGIENTASTVASVTGDPFGPVTTTSKVLSPDAGGLGSLRNATATPWPFDAGWLTGADA
jgi:hypothetical protein